MQIRNMMFLALIVGSLAAQTAFAQSFREQGVRIGQNEFKDISGVRIGQATLKSGVTQQGQYDTNVFLTSNNKKDDYISITTPKFLLDLPMGIDERHLLQLMYKADAAAFSNYKSQNYVNQNAAANINMRLPFGYFNINDDFRDTVDRADTEFTDQLRRQENRAQTILGVEINKLTYEFGYSNLIKRYYENQYNNLEYKEDVYSGTIFYQMFPKTKALVEYDHGLVRYTKDQTRNSEYDQFMVGLRGEITGKTTGLIKVGFQNRDYDVSGNKGYSGFVSETGLTTTFSERTRVILKYITTAVESISTDNRYYNANVVNLTLDQKLMGRWSSVFLSGIERNRYPQTDTTYDIKRQDTVITESAALKYDMKDWCKTSVGYQYKENMSNIDAKSYNDHLVSLRTDILF